MQRTPLAKEYHQHQATPCCHVWTSSYCKIDTMRSAKTSVVILFSRALVASSETITLPTPVICDDSLGNQPPFNSNNVPCLLGCGGQITIPTGSLLPGSVNLTEIPYCQLNCVRKDATPAQSSAAPGCYESCKAHNQATPDNIGWCMYWCVDGLGDLVASTSCVPQLEYGQTVTTIIDGHTFTYARTSISSLLIFYSIRGTNSLKPSLSLQLGQAGMKLRLSSQRLETRISQRQLRARHYRQLQLQSRTR
jgi:hypothetical protein